jgi:hypothetical protein
MRHLLTELARTGHTGALHVGGTPGGTIYLVAGRISYAVSPACPDIRERLLRSGRLTEAGWDAAYRAGTAQHMVGRLLVQHGGLEQGELVCHVLATICDAGHAVLRTPDADLRFVPDERHWLGLVTQLELTALSREMVRRDTPNALPRRLTERPAEGRAPNSGPRGDGAPDYATLKRIRQALKSAG